MIDTSLIRIGYDQIATRYAETRDQSSSLPYLEKLNSTLSARSLVLDLGCGAGLPVDRWLIEHGHTVIGLDLSAEMLSLARRNVPETRYEVRDMAELEEGEYAVDAVVCLFAMFHIDRSRHGRLLRCLHSYLAPRGLLLITTGGTDWEGQEDFLGVPMAWSHFDRAANRALIESAGFVILLEDRHSGNSCGDDDWHPIFLAQAE